MVTATPPEIAMQQMLDALVQQFDPVRVYLLDLLISGDQRVWHEANFLVVLEGEWDYREKLIEIMGALPRTGFGALFHLSRADQFAQRCERLGTEDQRAADEGRLLYERG